MTTLLARAPGGRPAPAPVEAPDAALGALVARLRDAADQMVAFSQVKTLLREAASVIERLESGARLNRGG
jgi:hypothetical protein